MKLLKVYTINKQLVYVNPERIDVLTIDSGDNYILLIGGQVFTLDDASGELIIKKGGAS